jgi:hypothetical protein
MKEFIFVMALSLLSHVAAAEAIRVDLGRDEAKILEKKGIVGAVDFFEDGRPIGRFSNLVVEGSSLSSNLIEVIGGGVAIEVNSGASRSKYQIIAPVINGGGKLYTECSYKLIYDAVDEQRSVGMECQRAELAKFDASSVINNGGMVSYDDHADWIKKISPATCPKAVGLELNGYRVVRCAEDGPSESKKQRIIIFDGAGRKIAAIDGFEFIPDISGSKFGLISTANDRYVIFRGDLECLSRGSASAGQWFGRAKIAGKLSIKYVAHEAGGCYSGRYSYIGNAGNINFSGYKHRNMVYLLEMDEKKISSGLFVLNRFDSKASGVWVKVPPKTILSVN